MSGHPATVRGRIPGRPGLWDVTLEDGAVSSVVCVEDGYDAERCAWITPGLFDLQVNGLHGIDFTDPDTTVARLAEADGALRDKGVSRYLATIITRDAGALEAVLSRFAEARERGAIPGAAGIHVEGPYISPEDGYRGVHQRRYVRDPDPAELERLQRAARGFIRLVTIAPERPGAEAFIRAAVAMGIRVAMGHTAANAAETARAADAGLTLCTHLFNGCAQLVDRHANVLYAQLAEDRLWGCFIADGHHVPMPTLRVGLRAKGWQRSILVSDVTRFSGLPDGTFMMEDRTVEKRDGGVFVKGSPLLSGAARTLDEDIAVLAREREPGIERCLLMATAHPAAALAEPAWAGIAVGRRGPIVVFAWDGRDLALQRTLALPARGTER
jgi:N-acetylglucosamine-6-phosphate deacetylase